MSDRDNFRRRIDEYNINSNNFEHYDRRHEEIITYAMVRAKEVLDYMLGRNDLESVEETQQVFDLARERISEDVYNGSITSELDIERLFYDRWFYALIMENMERNYNG